MDEAINLQELDRARELTIEAFEMDRNDLKVWAYMLKVLRLQKDFSTMASLANQTL